MYDMFPSPCGDYGSYPFRLLCCLKPLVHSFRPLAGIMVLILSWWYQQLYVRWTCFRPLAGIMVLITDLNSLWIKRRNTVSVPLRGLWFLSFMVLVGLDTISHLVSVPLRGLWFLSCRKRANKKWIRESFRPLAGIMVLIFPRPCTSGSDGIVSVPLRGLWFLSVIFLKIRRDLYEIRFRPLAGIMVLIVLFAWTR